MPATEIFDNLREVCAKVAMSNSRTQPLSSLSTPKEPRGWRTLKSRIG